jgi:two-component system sensor histidine kinase DegS
MIRLRKLGFKGVQTMLQLKEITKSYTTGDFTQIALNNVKKHAKASCVKVSIEDQKDKIRIIVQDNGVGFDIEKLNGSPKDTQSGFGFYSMKERIELINGTLQIKGEIGKGTRVTGIIPKSIEEGL